MKRKLLTYISVALNIVLVLIFIGKRYYYSHSGQPQAKDPRAYFNIWNASRQSVLGALPIDTSDIVFVGTSITEGLPVNEMFPGLKIKNRGITSNRTIHILHRIGSIATAHPRKIFLECGINDIISDLPAGETLENIKSIVDTVRTLSPRTKLFFTSLFPAGGEWAKYNDAISSMNSKIDKLCRQKGAIFVNVFPLLFDAGNSRLDEQYTFDGVHPNGKGYGIWKEKLAPYL